MIRKLLGTIDRKTLTGKGTITAIAGILVAVLGLLGVDLDEGGATMIATGISIALSGVVTSVVGVDRRTREALGSTEEQRARKAAKNDPLEG